MSEPFPSCAEAGGAFDFLALRERLLAGLLRQGFKDERPSLTQRDEGLVRVRLASGVQVALVTCAAGTQASALRSTLTGLVHQNRAGIMHIVVVGGGREVHRELKKSAPFWQLNRRFGFHHLELDKNL